ncbi:phosphosugar isomerase [Kineosporiaceae bacterium SCSIO 59966]|nr:phosphosugar isomerase [Kineosporiaceae bacterium SCSIO 59966]
MTRPFDEQLLDDPEALAAADPSGVLRAVAGAGAQVRHGLSLAAEAPLDRLGEDRPRTVVIAARGGARAVGDAVEALAGPGCPVPVVCRSGTVLPGWVGPLDLVIAVSLSGQAQPAVALAAEAGRRGARVLTVGAAGSLLAEVSAQVRGVHVPVPLPGLEATSAPTSRTSLWAMLTPVLVATTRLGLTDAGPGPLGLVADTLDEEARLGSPATESFVNPAKSLAVELADSVPVLLGDGPATGVAARRAASVLARTARVPAVAGTLPDDAGDVVATFGGPFASTPEELFADPFLDPEPTGPRLRLVLLREGPTSAAAAVVELAERSGVKVSEVVVEEPDPLRRLAALGARTDFAATYLALGLGLDPAESPHVADLARGLE